MDTKKLFTSFFLLKSRVNKQGLSPIYLRVTVSGHRETLATNIFIPASSWDENKGLIKGDSQLIINQNNLLQSLKGKAISVYTELLNSSTPITAALIKTKMIGKAVDTLTLLEATKSHNAYIKKKIGIETTKATHTKYETLRIKLEKFIQKKYKRKDFLLHELKQNFVVDFELYLKTSDGIGHNTTIKYIQFLKRIIHFSIANEWIQYSPFKAYRCTFKAVHREALTLPEISLIHAKNCNTERLNNVRDIFIFCCYTGLAYSDIKKLTVDEIVLGVDDKLWIQTYRTKTKTRVPVPLLPEALNLIKSYHEWRAEKGTKLVFPVLSNQKMNAYLKEIGDLSAISKPLTFHIARHTFATVALTNGVPIESVSKLLGHTNIKTTQQYAKVIDTKLAEDMQIMSERLLKGK